MNANELDLTKEKQTSLSVTNRSLKPKSAILTEWQMYELNDRREIYKKEIAVSKKKIG